MTQNGTAKRGMRARAERARALLLASGLPRLLLEEAMKHTTWLQNRTPARALDGKTPYEMRSKKKPHLAGIQEFGAAAAGPQGRKTRFPSPSRPFCWVRLRIKRLSDLLAWKTLSYG